MRTGTVEEVWDRDDFQDGDVELVVLE